MTSKLLYILKASRKSCLMWNNTYGRTKSFCFLMMFTKIGCGSLSLWH